MFRCCPEFLQWHSRNRYSSQDQLLTAAQTFHNLNINVSIIVIDYHHVSCRSAYPWVIIDLAQHISRVSTAHLTRVLYRMGWASG